MNKEIKDTLTRTRFGPKKVTGLVNGVGIDVNDGKGITFVGQIVDCPFQSILAALGEVHGHSYLPILHHLCPSLRELLLLVWVDLYEKRNKKKKPKKAKVNALQLCV